MPKVEQTYAGGTTKEKVYYRINDEHMTEDELKVFKEALFKSKGRTNNMFASYLAQSGATADEIVRLALDTKIPGDYLSYKVFINPRGYGRETKTNPAQRRRDQALKRVPNFFDTVYAKANEGVLSKFREYLGEKNIGGDGYLPMTVIDKKLSDETARYFKDTLYTTFPVESRYRDDVAGFLSFAVRTQDSKLPGSFLSGVFSDRSHGGDFIADFDKYQQYELDSIEHTDTKIEDIKPSLFSDFLARQFDRDFHYGNEKQLQSIKLGIQIGEFYHACREMGIVVIRRSNAQNIGRAYAKTKALMTRVIRARDQYDRLVNKQGFSMSVARTTMVDELNSFIKSQSNAYSAKVDYMVIMRNDIEDKEPVAKAVRTNSKAKGLLSYEELTAMVNKNDNGKEAEE